LAELTLLPGKQANSVFNYLKTFCYLNKKRFSIKIFKLKGLKPDYMIVENGVIPKKTSFTQPNGLQYPPDGSSKNNIS
jgi:hypothetical protein